eukprot:jgi/Botrbrau1/16487/Bobra.0142s0081.1
MRPEGVKPLAIPPDDPPPVSPQPRDSRVVSPHLYRAQQDFVESASCRSVGPMDKASAYGAEDSRGKLPSDRHDPGCVIFIDMVQLEQVLDRFPDVYGTELLQPAAAWGAHRGPYLEGVETRPSAMERPLRESGSGGERYDGCMGKIKNLEEKKKAARVFSSGSGGGTKGPSVVDKRNQELACPHCPRVFKQLERYREHLKKHAGEEDAGDDEGPSGVPPGPPGGPDASTSAGPAPAGPATRPPVPASAPGLAQAGKMMDVGAKAGYYTEKSPKMMLQEWCTQQKRARPRYVLQKLDGGVFGCKVVLPDPKDKEKDVVVFLPKEEGVSDETLAEQQGAVAALRRVQGDRALHRVLPLVFRGLWERLGLKEQAEAERRARIAEMAEAKRERERARREREARRAPAAVVMSETQRRMVESVLRDLRGPGTAQGPGDRSLSGDVEAIRERALELGFEEDDVAEAIANIGAAEGLEGVLDWLCVHVEESHLPTAFKHGGASKPVALVSKTGSSGRLASAEAQGDPALAVLLSCGYPRSLAVSALQACSGNQEAALALVFNHLCGMFSINSGLGQDDVAEPVAEPMAEDMQVNEAWEEEKEALCAIYSGDLCLHSQSHGSLCLSHDEGFEPLQLDFRIGSAYPMAVPLISVRCEGLPSASLLDLTKTLAEVAAATIGSPMVYELATTALQRLPALVSEPPRYFPLPSLAPSGSRVDLQIDRPDSISGSGADDPKPDQAGPASAAAGRRERPRNKRGFDAVTESRLLQEEAERWRASGRGRSMRGQRERLPASSKRPDLVSEVNRRRVLVISGATGCGKSTQVPQYLLEEAVGRGEGGACNIIVTQPRRISAVGLASRVAEEMGQRVGEVVGYSVRLDSCTSLRTRLLFCTTGILLRRLTSDPELSNVTHVIVDEVHERSVESDLLLLLLRRLLASPAGKHLKVVLMSATADANLFASYFSSALGHGAVGTLNIPGFTHPVKDLYLEDVLEVTRHVIGRGSRYISTKSKKKYVLN